MVTPRRCEKRPLAEGDRLGVVRTDAFRRLSRLGHAGVGTIVPAEQEVGRAAHQ